MNVEGAGGIGSDVIVDSSNSPFVVQDVNYTLGHNLTIKSGGVAIFDNSLVLVTQNYGTNYNRMYHLTVQDGGRLFINNSILTNAYVDVNKAAPGFGIYVRNGGEMEVNNSTLAFPGHFVVDDAKLTMRDSVVSGMAPEAAASYDQTYFLSNFFNDAPVMMFMSSDVQLYNTQFLDTYKNSVWNDPSTLYDFSYPFATDDGNRNLVTYSFQRNILAVDSNLPGEATVNLTKDDALKYAVKQNERLTTNGVDIAGLSFESTEVANIYLKVEYSTPYPFTGTTNELQFVRPLGGTATSTTPAITFTESGGPGITEGAEVIKSGRIPSMSSRDLAKTNFTFLNTNTKTVSIDRIWVEVQLSVPAYKNITLAGDTKLLAVDCVLDINNNNYVDEFNATWNKLSIIDQAEAQLYGTTMTDDAVLPSPTGVSPIACAMEKINILPLRRSILDNSVGSISNLYSNEDSMVTVAATRTLNVNQFNTTGLSGNLLAAKLMIRYTAGTPAGSNYIQWGIGTGAKQNAYLISQPTSEIPISFDLYANGVTTFAQLANLNITYTNSAGAANVGFDQLYVEITLGPSAYIYRFANVNLIDDQLLPVEGADIELADKYGYDPVYRPYAISDVSSVPPVAVLDYLGRTSSDYLTTDVNGQARVPMLTEIVNALTLPQGMDLNGTLTNIWYQATMTYVLGTDTYDEVAAISFPAFPEMMTADKDVNVTMAGLTITRELDITGTMYVTKTRNELQNIIVRGTGMLVLNATLFVKQSRANQFMITVQDNARLVINSGGLISSDQPLNVYLMDNANLTITGAALDSVSKVTIIADETSSAYIVRSGIGYYVTVPSSSSAKVVAVDTAFLRQWNYFGGQAVADLTNVTIPKLVASEDSVIRYHRWILVNTYDGSGVVKLSGVYVQLKNASGSSSVVYASKISDSNAQVRFKALSFILTAGQQPAYYGNYKINGTYWFDGQGVNSAAAIDVSLLYYTESLTVSNPNEKLIIPILLSDVSIVSGDVSFSPTNPVTNETATISATVRNLGSQAANNVNVTFYKNTTGSRVWLASRTIESLASGQSFMVNVPWTPNRPINDVITITLDEAKILTESTRGNNQLNVNIVVLDKPHISTSAIVFYKGATGTSTISTATVGDQVRISATLVNDGESTASNFEVSFWLNQPTTGILISTVDIATIPVDGTIVASTLWEATSVSGAGSSQDRTIYVTIDNPTYVLPSEQPRSQIIKVIDDRPDLVILNNVAVVKGTRSVVNASLGETVTIKFNVSNVGLSTATNAFVKVNLTKVGTNFALSQFNITLLAGQTKQYNVTWTVNGLGLALYDLNIWVNPNQTFREASSDNNHFMMDFSVVVLDDPNIDILLNTGGKTEFKPGDKITVSGTITSKDGISIIGQSVKISLRDSEGFQIGTAQTRTTDQDGWFITTLNVSPDYDGDEAFVTVTINDGVDDVSESVRIKISSDEGLPIPLWLILLIIVVIVLVIAFFSWYLYRYSLGKMVECGECGSLIPESSKRCPKCGTVFETGTAKCSECGAWIPANAAECPECHAKFLTIAAEPEKGDTYAKAMKEQYDQYVNGYRQQAMAALGSKYSEDKFQEWLMTEPGFLTYDDWLKKTEEERKSGVFPCPNCGTPNPRGSTICHKCGTVFATVKTEQQPEEKPRTFRKIVKRDKEEKPPESQ